MIEESEEMVGFKEDGADVREEEHAIFSRCSQEKFKLLREGDEHRSETFKRCVGCDVHESADRLIPGGIAHAHQLEDVDE